MNRRKSYDFRVFEKHGHLWLYDQNEEICSLPCTKDEQPHVHVRFVCSMDPSNSGKGSSLATFSPDDVKEAKALVRLSAEIDYERAWDMAERKAENKFST
jgi:hypothetical protein